MVVWNKLRKSDFSKGRSETELSLLVFTQKRESFSSYSRVEISYEAGNVLVSGVTEYCFHIENILSK